MEKSDIERAYDELLKLHDKIKSHRYWQFFEGNDFKEVTRLMIDCQDIIWSIAHVENWQVFDNTCESSAFGLINHICHDFNSTISYIRGWKNDMMAKKAIIAWQSYIQVVHCFAEKRPCLSAMAISYRPTTEGISIYPVKAVENGEGAYIIKPVINRQERQEYLSQFIKLRDANQDNSLRELYQKAIDKIDDRYIWVNYEPKIVIS